MAHGWGAVKEMYLDLYAQAFCDAGLAVLVYDHRNFGASDGEPRQEMDPVLQIRDYQNAITYAGSLDGIDAQRIGIWGTSYSGGHVLVVAATDRRVKCVVSQCPTISGWRNTLRRFSGDTLYEHQDRLAADRLARLRGEPPAMAPIQPGLEPLGDGTTDDIHECGNDGLLWFGHMRRDRLARWRNEITLRSVELYSAYEPGSYIARIAPTPLLILTGDRDTRTPTDEILAAYEDAREPKQLVLVSGGHYDLYGIHRQRCIDSAIDWYTRHLAP